MSAQFEDPKRSGRLTKHGIEMTCSICKSKTHNKRKCPDKDTTSVTLPPPKRGRGRPKNPRNISRNPEAAGPSTNDVHHDVTAQPTRVGIGGRVIRSGRGARGAASGGGRGARGGGSGTGRGSTGGVSGSGTGGTVGASGSGRGGRGGGSGRGIRGGARRGRGRGITPSQGVGVLFTDQGTPVGNWFESTSNVCQGEDRNGTPTQASVNQCL